MQRRHGTIVPSKSKELITIVAARITGNILEFYKKNPLSVKRGTDTKTG